RAFGRAISACSSSGSLSAPDSHRRVAGPRAARETGRMTTTHPRAATALTDAIVARDFAAARDLLHAEIDFRAMTPNRIWEADGPADVEAHLRAWLADPDEEITAVEATEPVLVEDTL